MANDDVDIWMTAARDEDDGDAFARVVEACHHLLRGTLLRETADPELADEIAQDALVRAWERRLQYRPGTSPRSWLLTIARSRLIEFRRREARTRRHLRRLVREELLRRRLESPDPFATSDGRQERLDALNCCLAELDEKQRTLIDLVHGKGLTTEGAAAELGIKPPACRQRLSRLQRALRRCAEKRLGVA